ncbi:MAG: hypothetical protein AAGA72_09185 [Pseudomonadota bacterium]
MTKALVVLAKLTRLYGALSVALFTLTTPVFAQTDSSPRDVFIESGDNAYANGNYRLALIVYTQSCRYGSATACVRAGDTLEAGV